MMSDDDAIMVSRAYGFPVVRALARLPGEGRTARTHDAYTHALCCIQRDTGELTFTVCELAAEIGADVAEAERVLLNLARLRVIVRDPRRADDDAWFINPHLAWSGSLATRAKLAALVPPPAVEPRADPD